MYEIDRGILAEARARIARDRKWDVQLKLAPPANASLSGSKVAVALTRPAFRFGCNGFQLTALDNADLRQGYEERFDALLNYATLPFYWGSYEATRGVTRESALRRMAAWCQEHNIATKGHPLVWHEVYPEWPEALPDEEVLALQRQRVSDIVSGFRGLVDTWDVVNEATVSHAATTPSDATSASNRRLRVDEMLRLAHDANPDAELLYNDFNGAIPRATIWSSTSSNGGIPMSVIGIQSHMHGRTWPLQESGTSASSIPVLGCPCTSPR